MENISYSVTFPSDNTKVVLPIMSKIELKLKMDTNMRTPFQGEIRVGKSEYEEFLEVVSGPLGDNIRTDYVLQAVSGGAFICMSTISGYYSFKEIMPIATNTVWHDRLPQRLYPFVYRNINKGTKGTAERNIAVS